MLPYLPIVFMFLTFIFNWLWERSRKPVYNNPVIFRDDGSSVLRIGVLLSMLGFAFSMGALAITGQ